jgi:hypothetical protein
MRVFNLACARGHAFEGWFTSGDDYVRQSAAGMIACPVCDSTDIEKKLSAPAVLRGGVSRSSTLEQRTAEMSAKADEMTAKSSPPAVSQANTGASSSTVMAQMLGDPRFAEIRAELAKHVRENTVNVGERFADEARAMHYKEKPQQNIRGQASRAETLELLEEGIDVMPIPFKVDLPDYQ